MENLIILSVVLCGLKISLRTLIGTPDDNVLLFSQQLGPKKCIKFITYILAPWEEGGQP